MHNHVMEGFVLPRMLMEVFGGNVHVKICDLELCSGINMALLASAARFQPQVLVSGLK